MRKFEHLSPVSVALLTALAAYAAQALLINLGPMSWRESYALATQGRPVTATVYAVGPANHAQCRIRYEVDGKPFISAKVCSRRDVGTSMPITYLPADPSVVTTDDPMGELMTLVLGPLVMAVIFGAANGGQWYIRRRAKALEALPEPPINPEAYQAGLREIARWNHIGIGGILLIPVGFASGMVGLGFGFTIAGFLLGLGVMSYAGFRVAVARCPRCGKAFNYPKRLLSTGRRCVHCGLSLSDC